MKSKVRCRQWWSVVAIAGLALAAMPSAAARQAQEPPETIEVFTYSLAGGAAAIGGSFDIKGFLALSPILAFGVPRVTMGLDPTPSSSARAAPIDPGVVGAANAAGPALLGIPPGLIPTFPLYADAAFPQGQPEAEVGVRQDVPGAGIPLLGVVNGRLAIDGANLRLSPYNGNRININGTLRTIPAAGVTLTTSGVSNSTLYYIYAYYTGGNVTLEYSATAYAVSATNGMPLKSGDSTRTLVGMARTSSGGAWEFCRSYYNDPGTVATNTLASDTTTASGTYVEVSSSLRTGFLVWADETIDVRVMGMQSGTYLTIAFDGTTADSNMFSGDGSSSAGNYAPIGINYPKRGLSEGYHYATLLFRDGAGTETPTVHSSGSELTRLSVVTPRR